MHAGRQARIKTPSMKTVLLSVILFRLPCAHARRTVLSIQPSARARTHIRVYKIIVTFIAPDVWTKKRKSRAAREKSSFRIYAAIRRTNDVLFGIFLFELAI